MSNDAGMALLAYIDAVHLDDALAWVETGDGCHRAWRETERERRDVKGKNYCTSTHPGARRKSHLPYPVHKIELNNIVVVFTTLFPVFAAQEECERERGEEGNCLSGVNECVSEGCDSERKRASRFTAIRRKCVAD